MRTRAHTPRHNVIWQYYGLFCYSSIDKISLVSGFFLLPVLQCVSFNIYSLALFVTLLHFISFLDFSNTWIFNLESNSICVYLCIYFNLKAYCEINKYSCAASLMITCHSILLNLSHSTSTSCINALWALILGYRGVVVVYKPTSHRKGCSFFFNWSIVDLQCCVSFW